MACDLATKITQTSPGGTIDGAGCVERSYVELRKRLTLKNITVKGTDDWTGRFSPSGGNHRSTLTVPEFVESQQTSDPMNTTLCEPQDAAMLCGEAEMVFLDGRYLSQRPNGADPGPGEFALDAGRRVVLGEDPAGKRVEVATRQRGLQMYSGSGGAVLENVHVTRVANTIGKSGAGAALGNNGNALTVRDSEVSWTHGSGFQCGGGVRCEVTASEFRHAGEAGMTSYAASPLLFDNNTVRDNCSQTGLPDVAYNDSFVCSGLKITGESPAGRTVTDSVFHHNDHAGIWTDVRANDTEIARNRIHHNEEQGMHVEISNGIDIHGNVLYENGWVGTSDTALNSGDIYNSDSANVKVYDNVMAWSRDGFAYIGGPRNTQNGGNEFYNNHVIHDAYDIGGKHILSGWLPRGEADLVWGQIGHDNEYYYGGLQDESIPRKFQGDATVYAKLSDFNKTPYEEGGSYLTASEKNALLSEAAVPTTSEH